MSNAKQLDSDKDGIGDQCDNAINVKNYDQSDLDYDGIGDVKDNCKTIYNPHQIDSDKDEIGDECDDINNSKKDEKNKTPSTLGLIKFSIFALLLISLASLGFYFWKKQKQS